MTGSATGAVPFRLPLPWSRDLAGDCAEITARFDDLKPGLKGLAAVAAVPFPAVLLAAHLKVLTMLGGGPGQLAPVLTAGAPHAVLRMLAIAEPGPAWRDLAAYAHREYAGSRNRSGISCAATRPCPDRFRAAIFDARQRRAREACRGSDPAVPGRCFAQQGLRVTPGDGQLRISVAGITDPAVQARRLAAMYRAVLAAMAADPGGDARAACLPATERETLMGWSQGTRIDRGTASVAGLIEEQAAATPAAVAVRAPDGVLTYAELIGRSRQIGHYLAGLGARTDSLAGVCLRRSANLLPALIGTWLAGAAYLPLDPCLPPGRLRHMLAQARCPLVLTTTELLPHVEPYFSGRIVLLDAEREAIAAQPAGPTGIGSEPGQLAYAIYTSGSTGDAKGVLIEHAGLANYLCWTIDAYASWGLGGAPVFSSISFDLGIPSLFTPLLTGQATHLLPDPLDVADLAEELTAGGPYSFIKLTPGHLDLLTHQLTPSQIRDLAGLVIAAGDAFPTTLASRWLTASGPGGTRVGTEYGPTEITIGNSGQPLTDLPDAELVPLGAPIPNTTMYVLTDGLEPVPVGVIGEIYVGGAGVARGYLGRQDLTDARFVPDPYGPPGARLYRTGDLGRWHFDGTLHFLGRVDSQVKIRGYRVEPAEIEANLRSHPAVGDAVVTATGTGAGKRLIAHVVPADGRRADAAELRRHLAASLPEYMIPAEFTLIPAIPLTPNGKLNVRALRPAAASVLASNQRKR